MTELLRGGRGADGQGVDIRIVDDLIGELGTLTPLPGEAVVDLDGRLVLPAFAEPHVHLDKAFTAGLAANQTGDLQGAMASYSAVASMRQGDAIADRAMRALRLFVAAGTTAVRCQIGAGRLSGVTAIEALAKVREQVSAYVDLQIVAHVGVPDGGAAGHRALLHRALDAGADQLGGNPFSEDDPDLALESCLEVALDRGVELDLHVDESFDSVTLDRVAARALESGVRVVAAHCVSLGVLPDSQAKEIAAAVAAAGMSVVTLPMTNLFLQGRDVLSAKPRGLTAIDALRAAGVQVAAGSDNVRDPFNLVGRCDPLEIASLLVTAGHQQPVHAAGMVGSEARTVMGLPAGGLVAGAPAELVALGADDLGDAIARAPGDRLVWHRGQLVAQTVTTTDVPF
ncbi:amidohydrolase family protein [Kribbella solani]|uniref:Cytosine deaminase n=1 Tax=Kribbella solani TaxID=236067 RepID=A0A841DVS6_9ACTN|nr:amidohydrolase family protein [Kribbella solani]MBB5980856.1 cytosine deaminase [Kribbella solani]